MQQQGSLDEDGGNCTEHSDCSFFDCQGECDKIAGKCRNVVANNNLQVYEIHINGVRHCSLRYRQLHTLHEKLKREFHPLPHFPPKKLMSLSLAQLEERRLNLEKYLQLLSQDPR